MARRESEALRSCLTSTRRAALAATTGVRSTSTFFPLLAFATNIFAFFLPMSGRGMATVGVACTFASLLVSDFVTFPAESSSLSLLLALALITDRQGATPIVSCLSASTALSLSMKNNARTTR